MQTENGGQESSRTQRHNPSRHSNGKLSRPYAAEEEPFVTFAVHQEVLKAVFFERSGREKSSIFFVVLPKLVPRRYMMSNPLK